MVVRKRDAMYVVGVVSGDYLLDSKAVFAWVVANEQVGTLPLIP